MKVFMIEQKDVNNTYSGRHDAKKEYRSQQVSQIGEPLEKGWLATVSRDVKEESRRQQMVCLPPQPQPEPTGGSLPYTRVPGVNGNYVDGQWVHKADLHHPNCPDPMCPGKGSEYYEIFPGSVWRDDCFVLARVGQQRLWNALKYLNEEYSGQFDKGALDAQIILLSAHVGARDINVVLGNLPKVTPTHNTTTTANTITPLTPPRGMHRPPNYKGTWR